MIKCDEVHVKADVWKLPSDSQASKFLKCTLHCLHKFIEDFSFQ